MPLDATRRRAAVLLGLVGLVAAVEWIAAARAYRSILGPADWDAAAAALAALPPDEPVLLADDWLGPTARRHLLPLQRSLGRPDLHGAPRFHVLALGEALPADLRADLGDLAPEPLGVDPLGPLTLHHFATPSGHVLWDILDQPALLAADRAGPCRKAQRTWVCKHGRATVRHAEIAYRPRRCLAIDMSDGAALELRGRVDLGARLRGHLGFTDFNGRLRNDAPAIVELELDGVPKARWLVSDNQGWAAFELATTPGPAELTIRVTNLLAGTFNPGGYDPETRRIPCLDLRAITEPT
ncbi:hypothetical protein [Nannocystis bainbridge]|uniref:NPCBM/NEW2 domain-containing protein n=1 Tax=Nannocystis bainbridge TaxID=2995303 RepID=A0ABT5E8S9_9BACT|nr:hypothetical protein [Nannocystis bainbridge]MDC0722264.1 hypothetical protein [Nannocystis bainbridge]